MLRSLRTAIAVLLFSSSGALVDAAPAHPAQVALIANPISLPPVGGVVVPLSVMTEEALMWGGASDAPQAHPAPRAPHLSSGVLSETRSIAAKLTRGAMLFLGTPYVFGGTSVYGFDCSGYVQHVFRMFGIHIPRTADAQYDVGRSIHGQISQGDLVFFQTYEPGASHVGIYLGAGKFVHASSHGVMVSHLSDSYWRRRYLGAKRLIVTNT